MFGGFGGKPKESTAASISELAHPTTPPPPPQSGDTKSVHGFDPAGLERAAKAAKELDKSANSKEAINIIKLQEVTKQKESEAERAKFMAMQQELAIQRVKEEEHTAARTLEKQTQHAQSQADYKDKLDRQRMVDQMNYQRQIQEEERKKAEASLERQESIRRKTLEYEADLRRQTEAARVEAETRGKIIQERENQDLFLERQKEQAKEQRDTMLQAIKLAGTTIGNGLMDFMGDKERLVNVTLALSGLALGVYTAKVGTNVTGRFIEARLGKPSLVRETTRFNVLQSVRHPVTTFKQAFSSKSGMEAMKDIVLEPTLSTRLQKISVSTSNTRKNKAPFRHLLLHGPPGTGKTMFAKSLARESGLHYAIMTGGDIAPLKSDAVTEIHKIFDWANTTNKGVLIFVDEADAFLRKRSAEKISEDVRNALNAFLYRTGEASKTFMIVYASNQPEQLDWAINDRVDEIVEFRLPLYEERQKMILQYMEKYLLKPEGSSQRIILENVTEEVVMQIAKDTEGFSGREISKLAIAWQAAAYGTANATIDADMLKLVLKESKASKKQKQSWLNKAEMERMVADSSV